MPPETHTVIVAPQESPGADGERLDRHLAVATGISRSRLKALIEAGAVTESGATIEDPSHRVKPGECYVISVPEAAAAEPEGQAIPLSIAYEDDHLVIRHDSRLDLRINVRTGDEHPPVRVPADGERIGHTE